MIVVRLANNAYGCPKHWCLIASALSHSCFTFFNKTIKSLPIIFFVKQTSVTNLKVRKMICNNNLPLYVIVIHTVVQIILMHGPKHWCLYHMTITETSAYLSLPLIYLSILELFQHNDKKWGRISLVQQHL